MKKLISPKITKTIKACWVPMAVDVAVLKWELFWL